MSTITYEGVLVVRSCWCGIGFAFPQSLFDEHRRASTRITCPLGHGVRFGGDTVQEQLDAEKRRTVQLRGLLTDERDQHHRTERRLVATRGVVTRTKRRIASGACPKCHVRFPDLKEHMHAEHPGYGGA